jgi:protein-tyrosine-phosphatase
VRAEQNAGELSDGRVNMTDKKIYNVLFLCTGNSARSILAEAVLNGEGNDRFKAYSAGSFPAGTVNPMAIKVLKHAGYDTDGLRSKSWDEFSGSNAPQMDFIITVCDNAANETCPVWVGHPVTAHWGFPDPAAAQGDDDHRQKIFTDVMLGLKRRIDLLLSLPISSLDHLSIQAELKKIGLAH